MSDHTDDLEDEHLRGEDARASFGDDQDLACPRCGGPVEPDRTHCELCRGFEGEPL